jgi:tetratricopeptide (TPR) repeat protein
VARAHLERALLDCQDFVVQRSQGIGASTARIEELKSGVRRDLERFMALMSDPDELKFAEALVAFSRLEEPGYDDAIRILAKYAAHTQDWRAYYWKGVAEIENQQFEEARLSLETALDSRRRCRASAYILDRLGVAFYFLNAPKEAERRFRSAMELDPALLGPKVNLASILLELERPEEAAKWSEEAIKADPAAMMAHAIRGQAYVMQHQARVLQEDPEACRPLLRAAKESLEKALAAFPPDSEQGRELKVDWEYVQRGLEY